VSVFSKAPYRALLLLLGAVVVWAACSPLALASEADLAIPDRHKGTFNIFGNTIRAWNLMFYGSVVIVGTRGFSLCLRKQIHALPCHESMLNISEIIFQTCKTYLIQQGKFLLMLWVLIAAAMAYYLLGFGGEPKFEVSEGAIAQL